MEKLTYEELLAENEKLKKKLQESEKSISKLSEYYADSQRQLAEYEHYDYEYEVKNDCIDTIKDRIEQGYIKPGMTYDEVYDKLYEDFFMSDRVTGNASGSYTFNSFKAAHYISSNLWLLKEALEEFGKPFNLDDLNSPEGLDVTIRCHMLGQVLADAIEEAVPNYWFFDNDQWRASDIVADWQEKHTEAHYVRHVWNLDDLEDVEKKLPYSFDVETGYIIYDE